MAYIKDAFRMQCLTLDGVNLLCYNSSAILKVFLKIQHATSGLG